MERLKKIDIIDWLFFITFVLIGAMNIFVQFEHNKFIPFNTFVAVIDLSLAAYIIFKSRD